VGSTLVSICVVPQDSTMMDNSNFSVKDFLLVSCPGAVGGLVCLQGDETTILTVDSSTGIFLDRDNLVVAHQFSGGRSLKVIDRGSSRLCSLSDAPLDLHDVLLKDGSLFVVATENNEVVEFNLESMILLNRWGLAGEPDSAHINSIIFYQGRLMASIFGRFEKNRGYKEGTGGLGQVIDVITGEIFIDGLSQPHSLTVVGDLLYLCNSEAKELRVYEGSCLKKVVDIPGYARGIAVSDDEIYVGISLSRNAKVEDESATASIIVLDRWTWANKGSVSVPFSEVYDVRVINVASDLVLKAVNLNAEQLIEENNRLLDAYEQTKSAYEQTREAYEHVREAYGQIQGAKMADEIRHNYEYDVDLNGETAPARVVRMVGNDKRVLEVGAGPGSITKMLKGSGNCRVTGLEIDKEAIKILEQFCERVYETNLNDPNWPEQLSDEDPFDVIVAADVLEHVYDPLKVLSAMAGLAGQHGKVVVSLPHVGHNAIVACLLDEDFQYRDWGLLDRTHIRFFGLKNMQQLFENAGLKIIDAQFVITSPQESEFADKWNGLSNEMKAQLSGHKHGQVYQVVIKAVSKAHEGVAVDLMQLPVEGFSSLRRGLLRKVARCLLSEKTRHQILCKMRKN